MSNYTAESFGFISNNGSNFFGYARNITVDSSLLYIPLLGVGLDTPLNLNGVSGIPGEGIIRLVSPVPSSITGYVHLYVENLTTSSVDFNVFLSPGATDGSFSGSGISVSGGDQVV